ncbi:MAG: sulfite exporter TauE/SafE family protein [Dehalococcoidia bacterium]
MDNIVLRWYDFLSTLNRAVLGPVTALDERVSIPILSVLLFGLLGITSPCQLSTNAGALAYIARSAGGRASVARCALAYLFGKVLAYTLLGTAAILLGHGLNESLIPVLVIARKVLGPLMLLLGLSLLGLIPLRFAFGYRCASWLEAQAGTGTRGAFLLGMAFSFAFCLTLFLLFFGLTIPLALRSPVAVTYPGVFAFGATLPLLGLAVLLTAGVGATQRYLAGARRVGVGLRPLAATVLVLAGLHDTVVYWFL